MPDIGLRRCADIGLRGVPDIGLRGVPDIVALNFDIHYNTNVAKNPLGGRRLRLLSSDFAELSSLDERNRHLSIELCPR